MKLASFVSEFCVDWIMLYIVCLCIAWVDCRNGCLVFNNSAWITRGGSTGVCGLFFYGLP